MLRRATMTVVTLAALTLSGACSWATDRPTPPPGGSASASPSGTTAAAVSTHGPPTAVSADRRGLTSADGSRFVWVGDTAWMLTQRLTREQIEQYLDARVAQGFTVIQMVAVAGRDGQFGRTANAQGDLPYDGDFGRLRTTPGADAGDDSAYDYWDHVDFAIAAAQRRGLTVALLPAWSASNAGSVLRTEHARDYGRFLARRLHAAGAEPVVWVMGGDDVEPHTQLWRELLAGIGETRDRGLTTYHPAGWRSSLGRLEDADFAMVQTSHCDGVRNGYPSLVADTRAQSPNSPVLDAEPLYEEHPWCWDVSQGYSTTHQVRSHLWWSIFAGGFGVTYGHHSVWQFHDGTAGINAPRPTWQEALEAPVAGQVRHLRTFLESAVADPLQPADAALVAGRGEGWGRALVMRSASGRRLSVYLPTPRAVSLDPDRLEGRRFAVTWFDPRSGRTVQAPAVSRDGLSGLTPPTSGGQDDWVLTLQQA